MTVAQARDILGHDVADRIAAEPHRPLSARQRAFLLPILLNALRRAERGNADAA